MKMKGCKEYDFNECTGCSHEGEHDKHEACLATENARCPKCEPVEGEEE